MSKLEWSRLIRGRVDQRGFQPKSNGFSLAFDDQAGVGQYLVTRVIVFYTDLHTPGSSAGLF